MSSNKKQASPTVKGLQGLLLGAGAMSTIEALRMLHKLNQTKLDRPTLDEIRVKKEDAEEEAATLEEPEKSAGVKSAEGPSALETLAGGISELGGGIWRGLGTLGKPVTDYAGDVSLDTAALAGGGLLGVWGAAEAIDNLQKAQAKKDTDRLREYYYSRLLEFEDENKRTKADTERTPVMRKQATSLTDILFGAGLVGLPAASFYLVKKYMDENFPGTKRPRANPAKDPRAQIARVREVEEDENGDPSIKLFEGIGKAASLSPPVERAWETAHLLRVASCTKEASNTLIPDILRTVARGGRLGLRKYALDGDMGGFMDYAEKQASAYAEPLSEQRRYLAADLVAADPLVRGMTMPIVCSELAEQFPTSVKMASETHPALVDFTLAMAKAETLALEEKLFPEALEKRASEKDHKPITLSRFIEINEQALA